MIKPKLVELPNGDWIDPNTVTRIYVIYDESRKIWYAVIQTEFGEVNAPFRTEDEAYEDIARLAEIINQSRI